MMMVWFAVAIGLFLLRPRALRNDPDTKPADNNNGPVSTICIIFLMNIFGFIDNLSMIVPSQSFLFLGIKWTAPTNGQLIYSISWFPLQMPHQLEIQSIIFNNMYFANGLCFGHHFKWHRFCEDYWDVWFGPRHHMHSTCWGALAFSTALYLDHFKWSWNELG